MVVRSAEEEERGPVDCSEDKGGLGLGSWVLVPAAASSERFVWWCGVV